MLAVGIRRLAGESSRDDLAAAYPISILDYLIESGAYLASCGVSTICRATGCVYCARSSWLVQMGIGRCDGVVLFCGYTIFI